jgi:hypothetical protein
MRALGLNVELANSDVPVAPGEEVVEHPEARPMLPPAAAE